jgi:hypothetical protein
MVILSEMDSVVVPQKRPRERESGTGNGNSGSVNGSVNGSTTGSADAEHDPDHEPSENGGNQSTNTAGSTNGGATNGTGEEKEHHRKRARLSCNICKARKTKVSWLAAPVLLPNVVSALHCVTSNSGSANQMHPLVCGSR